MADLLQGKDADSPTQIDLRAETVDGASLCLALIGLLVLSCFAIFTRKVR